jgi:hypothetical protein
MRKLRIPPARTAIRRSARECNLLLSGVRDSSKRGSRPPVAEGGRERTSWSDRDFAAEMPRLRRLMDRGGHGSRAAHRGGWQHPAVSWDCLCVFGILAIPPCPSAMASGLEARASMWSRGCPCAGFGAVCIIVSGHATPHQWHSNPDFPILIAFRSTLRCLQDPSPHETRFVTVDKGVSVEVLHRGGSGRPMVLLSGLGGTAHIFEVFAPKLAYYTHVYVEPTRR